MKPFETAPVSSISVRSYRPHDMLWTDGFNALISDDPLPSWVNEQWSASFPVIVRRDHSAKGLIPVGIRGKEKHQRAPAWISPENVSKRLSPEMLIMDSKKLSAYSFSDAKPVRAIFELLELKLPYAWGPTGSCAYALATGCPVMHEESDLDMLIRCNEPVLPEAFAFLAEKWDSFPCKTDIQIETPFGAFALKEWIREKGGKVLLKTAFGPILTTDPWNENGKSP